MLGLDGSFCQTALRARGVVSSAFQKSSSSILVLMEALGVSLPKACPETPSNRMGHWNCKRACHSIKLWDTKSSSSPMSTKHHKTYGQEAFGPEVPIRVHRCTQQAHSTLDRPVFEVEQEGVPED